WFHYHYRRPVQLTVPSISPLPCNRNVVSTISGEAVTLPSSLSPLRSEKNSMTCESLLESAIRWHPPPLVLFVKAWISFKWTRGKGRVTHSFVRPAIHC